MFALVALALYTLFLGYTLAKVRCKLKFSQANFEFIGNF